VGRGVRLKGRTDIFREEFLSSLYLEHFRQLFELFAYWFFIVWGVATKFL
jgi:hypothetical protein